MKITSWLLIPACAAVVGCGNGESIERPPQIDVRLVDAAPGYGQLTVSREAAGIATLRYGTGTKVSFDSGAYDLNVKYVPPGANQSVVAVNDHRNLEAGKDWVLVVVAPDDELQLLAIPTDGSAVSDTLARITVVHAYPGVAPLDIYLAAAGSDLSGLAPNGGVSFGPTADSFEVTPGTYHLYFTPANDPNTILFESNDLTVDPGDDYHYVITDPGGQGFLDLQVFEFSDGTTLFLQTNLESRIRAFQGIDDRIARDLLLDTDTMTPAIAALPFGELSADQAVTSGLRELAVTPVGVPGTIEATAQYGALPGRNYIAAVSGNTTDGITAKVFIEDRRRMVGQATLNMLNTAGQFDSLLLYFLPPGTDITTVAPSLFLPAAPDFLSRLVVTASTYEATFVDTETSAILAGPVELNFEEGGLYGIALSDAEDGSTIDLDYFYDFAP